MQEAQLSQRGRAMVSVVTLVSAAGANGIVRERMVDTQ